MPVVGEIRLGQFLKLAGLVAVGSDARPMLAAGAVLVNGAEESRRGRRLAPGDLVELPGASARVARSGPDDRLPPFALGDPGPRRDRLVAASLAGEKTVATSPEAFYRAARERLPCVGDRAALVDSDGDRVATVEILAVEVLALESVGDDVARSEGEGFRDADEWRSARSHEWGGSLEELRQALGDPAFDFDGGALVVVERYRVVDGAGEAG